MTPNRAEKLARRILRLRVPHLTQELQELAADEALDLGFSSGEVEQSGQIKVSGFALADQQFGSIDRQGTAPIMRLLQQLGKMRGVKR